MTNNLRWNPQPVSAPTKTQVSLIVQTLSWLGGVFFLIGGTVLVLTTSIFLALAGLALVVVGGMAGVGVAVILALRHP